jgi:hypothetical protein
MWLLNRNTEAGASAFSLAFFLRAGLAFAAMVYFIVNSEGTTDTGDGIMHYLFARYAPEYPLLYLDHWAKPVFTILASPFAQFGLVGVCLFNLCCTAAAGLFIMRALQPLGAFLAEAGYWACITSPQLFMANFTGLTEPVFAMLLAAGIMFAAQKKWPIAAVVWSFLPLSRTEGFFLLPVFALYFILGRNIKATLLLATGTFLFSVIGGFAKGDFLWIIRQNPYKGEALYGHGEWNHFFVKSEWIWGVPGTVLLCAGLLIPLLIKARKREIPNLPLWFTHSLVLVFVILHSVLWWKGLFGSLGLIRVMAAMAPLFALTMVRGLQPLNPFIKNNIIKNSFIYFFIILMYFTPWKQYQPPIKPDANLELIYKCSEWLDEKYEGDLPRMVFSYPLFSWVCNIDYFSTEKHIELSGLDKGRPANTLNKGDLVIWDSFFGPGSRRAYEQFSEDTLFREIKTFPAETEGGLAIYIFERQ